MRARLHRIRPVAAALGLALAAASLAPGIASAQSAQTNLTDRGQVQTFREVSEALVCQCGCNMILYVCNHHNCPSATPFRAEIERQIREGKGKDAIVASFVEKEGQVVLSAPPARGFDLAAWVMPFVALLLGGVFVLSFLGARRRTRAARGAAAEPAIPRDSYSERVDAEIEEIEG
jgi:cytochrome c-type biogenesis protein CcmH